MSTPRPPVRGLPLVKRFAVGALLVVVGFLGWTAFKLLSSWNAVEREPWDGVEIRKALEAQAPESPAEEPTDPATRSQPVGDHVFESFLVIGSGFQGQLADVIMLFLLPDGEQPAIVSLPRDLYLPSPCGGEYMRINANYNGCGDSATGPQLMALAVEDFTGIEVDHFALFDFEGFESIIDDVGGVTICVDNPVRDADAWLELPAGCTEATGAEALAWVRTRKTQELVDGAWRAVPGQSDLTRQVHQQDVIFQLFKKLQEFDSLGELTRKVDSLSDTFTVDSQLSLGAAISLAWSLRNYDQSEFIRLSIPVESYETPGGAQVLQPTASFSTILAEAYPNMDTSLASLG